MRALLPLILCFNALHVYAQTIPSTVEPGSVVENSVPLHQLEKKSDQSSYLLELQKIINGLQQENERLRVVKTKLKRECDVKFEEWVRVYNELFSKLQTDIPIIRALEGNISREMLRDEALRKAIKEVRVYLDVLKFKRIIMIGDIQILQGRQRQDYQMCVQYGSYFGFEPENEIGTRSFGRVIPVSNQGDIQTIIFERKKVWLEIKKDQETFQNIELKKFIEYYSGYCQRRIDNIKRLIEDLKKYPQATAVAPLEEELSRLKERVREESLILKPLENQLEELASEVKAIQRQYDSLQNAADCYISLNKWHIDNAVKQFESVVYRIENMDFSEMETYAQPSGPLEIRKSGDVSEDPVEGSTAAAGGTNLST